MDTAGSGSSETRSFVCENVVFKRAKKNKNTWAYVFVNPRSLAVNGKYSPSLNKVVNFFACAGDSQSAAISDFIFNKLILRKDHVSVFIWKMEQNCDFDFFILKELERNPFITYLIVVEKRRPRRFAALDVTAFESIGIEISSVRTLLGPELEGAGQQASPTPVLSVVAGEEHSRYIQDFEVRAEPYPWGALVLIPRTAIDLRAEDFAFLSSGRVAAITTRHQKLNVEIWDLNGELLLSKELSAVGRFPKIYSDSRDFLWIKSETFGSKAFKVLHPDLRFCVELVTKSILREAFKAPFDECQPSVRICYRNHRLMFRLSLISNSERVHHYYSPSVGITRPRRPGEDSATTGEGHFSS